MTIGHLQKLKSRMNMKENLLFNLQVMVLRMRILQI